VRVLIMPLAIWLWIGGGLMGVGTILAAFPGRRRRPTDPSSAPVRTRARPRRDDEAVADADLAGVP
jgi:hypothetical protein